KKRGGLVMGAVIKPDVTGTRFNRSVA
ncbi:MAG: hypothetical protein ACI9VS_003928, partial [Candidatus Binatia bacterium]